MQKLKGISLDMMHYVSRFANRWKQEKGSYPTIDDYGICIYSYDFERKFRDTCNIKSLDDFVNFYVALGGML